MLKSIGLDVPCMTELSNEFKEEGLDIDGDILTVDEMVVKNYVNCNKKFNSYI